MRAITPSRRWTQLLACAALVLSTLVPSVAAGARPDHAGPTRRNSPPGHDQADPPGKNDKGDGRSKGSQGKKGTPPGRTTDKPQDTADAETGDAFVANAVQQQQVDEIGPGDIRIDYVAAAQHTYDHSTGDGVADEYDSRAIGDKVVESLQGKDFSCGDLALFFAAISVNPNAGAGPAAMELDMSWTSESSGQPGAGFRDFVAVSINDNDSGNLNLDGNESATLVSESTGRAQGKPQLFATIRVSGLDAGDQAIVAMVTQIECSSPSPTGNLFSLVQGARLLEPSTGNINVGAQTLTMKRVQDLGELPAADSGTITITKDARPNATRDFAFSGLGGFSLDDDLASATPRSRTFSDLGPGTYVIVEQPATGWALTALECDDPSGGTTVDVSAGTATISLEGGDDVGCVFVNERSSSDGESSSETLGAPREPAVEAGEPLPLTGTELNQFVGAALLFMIAGAGMMGPAIRRRRVR